MKVIMKKNSRLIGLFLASSLLTSSLCLAQQNSFNPSGYFIPLESQTNSSNVRWILLSDYCKSQKKCPLVVELRIGSEKKWKTFLRSFLTIEGDGIIFKTKAANEVSYEFQGHFYPNQQEKFSGQFDESSNASTALIGVLKTKRGSRTLMTETLNFYFTMGD
jgi:hypothetical protein